MQFFEEEQNLLARLVHQLVSQDTDEHFELLRAARERFNAGGPKRLRYTLGPLAFAALRLVRTIKEGTTESKKADGACKTVSALTRLTKLHYTCYPGPLIDSSSASPGRSIQ